MKIENRFCYECGKNQEFAILLETEKFDARESSHVVAWGSSHVVARGSSHVEASKYSSVTIHSKVAVIKGGVQIAIPEITTARDCCEFYGAKVQKDVVVLYKAVNEDYGTQNGVRYTPGTKPEASDWDGGEMECGGGLHFSFHPQAALRFRPDAKKFIACPVKLQEIVVHRNAQYPDKIKARRVCAPVWECDQYGKRIGE